MGLLKKFKNIFVEEYEEEEEEVVQMPSNFENRVANKVEPKKIEVEPPKPILREIVAEEKTVERPIVKQPVSSIPVHVEEEKIKIEPIQPKKEEKFVFPVYFDDNDFDEIEKKKEEKPKTEFVKKEIKPEFKEQKKESSYKEAYNNKRANLTEDKKIFKPTPIISPVYGVLDKNYYKEDIVVTTSVTRTYTSVGNKPMSVDDVRNKAYGTLEDDLADTIISDTKETEKVEPKEETEIFNANDFATAVEEDKKRDIVKDGLKSDIESLLNNEEFTSALNFRKTKIEEPIEEEVEDSVDEEPVEEKIEEVEKPESTEKDADLSLIDDIMALAASGKKAKTSKKMNNSEEITNTKVEEDNESANDELELPTIDNELDTSYDDVSDLNDSDLFNLIDSMYDKEDK